MENGDVIVRAMQSAFALYGLVYLTTATFFPGWFLDTISINHTQRRRGGRNINVEPWWMWPWALLTMIAVGVVVFAALHALVSVIPAGWGSIDEDGEWQSTRWFVQSSVGFIASIALCLKVEANAEVLIWGPVERNVRQILSEAVRCETGLSLETREKLAASVDTKLQREDGPVHGYENDLASDIHRWVRRDIRG